MEWKIPFGDLKIGETARKNVLECLAANWVSQGEKTKRFEQAWGELFGYKNNIAMHSGTDADFNACLSLYDFGAKRGDEIIVPALCFVAAPNSILAAGFKPVFVDVERQTLNINPDKIEEKISPRTRAIMAVHTMGKPCAMDKIMEIARENRLCVIEDACEAHGAEYRERFVGNWGDMATFSFYQAHLVCCGEGGMLSTNSDEMAEVIRSTKNHGRKGIYFDHIRHGWNSRMTDLAASIALEGVEKFWKTFDRRKDHLYYLLNQTRDLAGHAWFNLEEGTDNICPHAFSVVLKDPKFDFQRFYSFLEEKGIQCKRNFGSNPTQHRAFEFIGHKTGEFPEAEYVGENGLHFGIHQHLEKRDLDYASEVLHEYFKQAA